MKLFIPGRVILGLGFVFMIGSFGCTSGTISKTTEKKLIRPNILWIVADDLGTDLGCYGDSLVYTPNLDKLAREGVRYINFYTVTAVCSPSRSTLITGMYPVSIEAHQHRTRYKKPLPEGIDPITKYFREAGYFTCNGDFRNSEKSGKTDYNFVADSIFDGTDWSQREDGQPFFAQVQIFYPHRPFLKDTLHPVDQARVKLPPYYPDHWITRQDWALYLETIQILDIEVGKVMKRLEEENLFDNTIVFFFGDQGRPHVRAKQFMYDGGIHTPMIIRLPGKIRSQRNDEVIISWEWPAEYKKSGANNDLVSNVDLAVASLYLAGIEIPGHLQGMNFLDPKAQKRDYVFSMRDRRDETVDRIRAIRTKDFKYIRNFYPERPYTQFNAYKKQAYPVLTLMQIMHENDELTQIQCIFMANNRPAEELYDLNQDPWEVHNLSGKKDYEETLLHLRSLMDSVLLKYEKGIYPETEEEIEFAEKLMKDRFKKQMENKGLSEKSTDEEILEYWKSYLTPTPLRK